MANSTVDVAPCYCPGTLIKTDRGQKRVEKLKIGDTVMTVSGEARPIKWIGRTQLCRPFRHGAQGHSAGLHQGRRARRQCAERDLWISPHHAMYLDGVLIEAKDLVNGVSIVQAESVDSVEYSTSS